ncbi:hypothetical protein WS72_23645 [Burkholderia savannae]|uniref:Uncharacterized protein n=1 Tax=Burkholderia savannae TaxID=1637837 RepID=A0ABR5T3V3_9BURK|nr:hypothetical protein WS72_23645 [Burkholderia savannae]KWZ48046.1 hypothetical protein WS73_05845 [Burkholderia savannae]
MRRAAGFRVDGGFRIARRNPMRSRRRGHAFAFATTVACGSGLPFLGLSLPNSGLWHCASGLLPPTPDLQCLPRASRQLLH